MAFQRGTATDYRDCLDKLDKFLTNSHVATIAINAGGTGYAAGDILSVAGGTVQGSMTARIEVLTVSSGVIATARLYDAGAYSANPTLTANAVTGGTGSGATFDLTMQTAQWTNRIKNISTSAGPVQVVSGEIGAGGTGYSVSDVVTLADTMTSTVKATFTVSAVSGGVVTGITLNNPGAYSGTPQGGNIATTGGTGSGLTIDPLFDATRDEYFWEGDGTGGNEVFVGARTMYVTVEAQRSWELFGATGWDSGSNILTQPGLSPGQTSLEPFVGEGMFVMFQNATVSFWFKQTARSIVVVINNGGNYTSGFMGLLDPFGTTTEFPYPLFICGSADVSFDDLGLNRLSSRGIADPTALSASTRAGPGQFRDSDAVWHRVWNGRLSGSDIDANNLGTYFVYPTARVNLNGLQDPDLIAASSTNTVWEDIIPADKNSTGARFKPTPDSPNNLYWPIPCTVVRCNGINTHKSMGEIPGVFWVAAEDGLSAEDKITFGARVFRVFKMGNNSLAYAHFCVEEV